MSKKKENVEKEKENNEKIENADIKGKNMR